MERECEVCNGKSETQISKHIYNWKIKDSVRGYGFYNIRFCPYCGRKLEEVEQVERRGE